MAKKKAFTELESDVESFITTTETEKQAEKQQEREKRGRKPQQRNSLGELTGRSDRITIYFTPETMDMIALIARAQDKSKNKFVTEIVEAALKKEKYQNQYEAMRTLQQSF